MTDPELEIEELFLAAPAAQGAVFQAQLAGAATYLCRFRVRLVGRIDEHAFEAAVRALVMRHQALRSAFDWETERITQVVYRDVGTPLSIEDWRDRTPEAQVAALADAEREDLESGFDASAPPLIRFRLIRLEDARYELSVPFFHGLLDGWSTHLLMDDLWTLYRSIASGTGAKVSSAAPYRPYAEWLVARDRSADVAYWTRALASSGQPAEGLLRVGRGTANAVAARRTVRRQLPVPVGRRIVETARSERCTLANWFSLAWALTLSRYADRDDVIFGVTTAHRPAEIPRVDELIGAFFNTVPLRVRLAETQSVREALGVVRDRMVEHQEHAFLSPAEIQRAGGLRGDAAQIETSVRVQTIPGARRDAIPAELRVESATLVDLWHYAACLVVEPGEDGIEVRLDFDPGRFSDAEMERALGHVEHVLDQMTRSPSARLGQIDLLTSSERRLIIDEWNSAPLPPGPETVLEMVEAGARRFVDTPVVEIDGRHYTAGELDRRADRFARVLAARGVATERFVLVEPSAKAIELFALALGVWKAGGALWPRDPRSPLERIRPLLQELPVALYVGSPRGAEALGITESATLEQLIAAVEAQPDGPRLAPPHPASAALVILTSGTSGVPSAVVHTQGSQVCSARGISGMFGPAVGDRFYAAEPLSAIAAAMRRGSLAVVPPFRPVFDAEFFTRFIVEQQIRFISASPSHLSMLDPDRLPNLSQILSSGEALTPALAARWSRQPLAQQYFMTEVSGGTQGPCGPDYATHPHVGPRLPGRRIYVLDSALRPVPIGVEGEIYMAGPGLARGYAGRFERTAERFLPDPFTSEPGARMYRSGDLGMFHPDGRLAVLGRNDRQVNVRGFRVELEEIESRIAALPQVGRAAVLQLRHPSVGPVLVAYVEPTAGDAFDLPALKTLVNDALPDYMRPAFYVVVPRLPTAQGGTAKVLRSALPAPDWSALDSEHHEAPRGGVEQAIADIFEELLGATAVGRFDRFFDLGGHSLLATQVVARVRSTLGVELPVRALFDAPTVAGLAERIASAQHSVAPPIEVAPRVEHPALSFAQERLWFLDQMEPGKATYNIPAAVRLKGTLEVEALRRSIEEVVSRHESLRTTFALREGRPYQRIAAPGSVSLAVEAIEETGLTAAVAEEMRRPFDLEQGPLVRARLFRLGPAHHVLAVTMHHIVSDGWSMGVLVRELGALYAAFLEGKPSPLAALPVQYADYAAWQRTWLQGQALDDEVQYWTRQLAGAPPLLELPTDRPRPSVQQYEGKAVRVALSAAQTSALKKLAQAEGATLYMALLAAWQVLLCRYSRQTDVVVGSPIANRTRREIEGLIGFFVNTLALRTDLSGAPSFRELLAQVRQTTLSAYAHQDVPFERVVEAVNPARSLSHAPLFQAMFVLQNVPGGTLALPGVTLELLAGDAGSAMFDLELHLSEENDSVHGALNYSTALFDERTVVAMSQHLVRLIDALIARADDPVLDVPMLSAAEERQLRVEWNDTSVAYEPEVLIHEEFEARARQTPGAVAVAFEGETLTYAELDRRSNQLAGYLQAAGVGPDTLVGVCVERSLEMVVGLLGILKTGGGYVPFDPSYPAERLAYMVADAGVGILLTQERLKATLPASGAKLVCLDSQWLQIASGAERKASKVRPENLAYMIYTSGSTGRPKGAMNRHVAIGNRLRWMQQQYALTAADVVLQKTPFSFDVSVWEFFWPLMTGARLVVARPEGHQDPAYLAELIERQGVTTVHFVPSMLAVFLTEAAVGEKCRSLRQVMCSGEALPYELQERFLQRMEGVALHNLYGPTEAAVDVTFWQCERNATRKMVPIGRPVANTQMAVLDERLALVPIGVPGELYIAGVQLGRGYLGRAELTAERFIPNPQSAEPGARMYRTGDVARWLPDGAIEYLGRADHQVKVRGFRIELGEIESALGQVQGVREAVVVARGEGGDKQLVGYVVGEVDAGALKAALRSTLPEYMVPPAFVKLDAMPLSPNGKIDRKALPAPEWAAEHEYLAPRTVTEEQVAAIWAQLLKRERVGVHDDFFELGGHSLLAMQVVAQLRRVVGVELSVRALFDTPTVAGLAEHLSRQPASASTNLPPLQPVDRSGDLPLAFAQEPYWGPEYVGPKWSRLFHQCTMVRIDGPVRHELIERVLTEVVRRQEGLRTSFRTVAGRTLLRVVAPMRVIVPIVDLPAEEGAAREETIRQHVANVFEPDFDLATPPLLRAVVLRASSSAHFLVLVTHHIVSDGWAILVLMRELSALYSAFSQGQPSPLPELTIQPGDFAVWERKALTEGVLQQHADHWKRHLRGASTEIALPYDVPRSSVTNTEIDMVALDFDAGTTALVVGAPGGSFASLWSAFAMALHLWTGEDDMVVGTVYANRDRVELADILGCFVNFLPLRVRISGDETLGELRKQLHEEALGAFEHAILPFGRVIEALQPPVKPDRNPLYNVLFDVHDLTEVLAGQQQLRGISVVKPPIPLTEFRVDFCVLALITQNSVRLEFLFRRPIFERSTIESFSRCYRRVLGCLLEGPELKLNDVAR